VNGPLRRLAASIFLAFAVLVAAVTWIQVVQASTYRDDPRNLRVAAGRSGRERGTIITADGVVVAVSDADPSDARVFRRSYPEAELYAHVVGYSTVLFGSTGLERTRSAELVSDRDATISGVINAILGDDLRPQGLQLTINHDLQVAAAEALGDQAGAVVAMDPRTGEILALVSQPTFDPNRLLGTGAGPAGAALEADPDAPLLNRALDATYPPGSTFKIVTAAAALETGQASPGTSFPDPVELALPGSTATIRNYSRRPCGSDGSVTLAFAFARSCNTTFAQIGMNLGADALVRAAEDFGFNSEIPLDADPAVSVVPEAAGFGDDLPAIAQTAIGQRDVRASPLQMLLTSSAVANGGEVVEPRLVSGVFNADGEMVSATGPVVWRRATSPATAGVLANLMEQVVQSGTGAAAAIDGVRVAGKTGTAEVPGAAPHAWFTGFAPVGASPDEPQIAVVVLVESGGDVGDEATGGSVAAPIARTVIETYLGG
jgi:peptidoglycan glycosyltransferase